MQSYYLVRNSEGSTLKGYGCYGRSAPKLYISYGIAQRYANELNEREARFDRGIHYDVVEVTIEEVTRVNEQFN